MVATLPEPTVLPPSRSDLVVFRNLFVTVFAVLWLILWVFYLLFYLFPGELLQIRITDSGSFPVYHALLSASKQHRFRPPVNIVAWANRNVNWFFTKFVRPSLISGRVGERNYVLRMYHTSNELRMGEQGAYNKCHCESDTHFPIPLYLSALSNSSSW